jgi:hypothetical protein
VVLGAGLVLPLVTAVLLVLCVLVTTLWLIRRRKSADGDGEGRSIVVYPTNRSGGPQFL